MAKINILTSDIYNRISAGEVVESPQSVVKELLENAVDAGATSIEVAIKDGGKYIRIIDNGVGMSSEDMPTAFIAHATSKIKTVHDLDEIKTLGFRGEALPSIASVSKVTVISRTVESELGHKIVIDNSKIVEQCDVGSALGTTVIVEDIFKNIPARLKFLKSDKAEESSIVSLVNKMALSNYNVSISLYVGEKKVLVGAGTGMKDAIFSVYGSKFFNEMMYVQSNQFDISVSGYVNKPNFSKHNRNYQTLIVNGRYVVNTDISYWVFNCMQSYLMKRQYPAFVLYINLPFDMVDINVHPNKMEVKFINYDIVRRLITTAISSSIASLMGVPKCVERGTDVGFDNAYELAQKFVFNEDIQANADDGLNIASGALNLNFAHTEERVETVYDKAMARVVKAMSNQAVDCEHMYEPTLETMQNKFQEACVQDKITSFYDNKVELRLIGTAFNTYIIMENPESNELYLIDQHAMHEKILYDKLCSSVNEGCNNVQILLVPYVFELGPSDSEILSDCESALEEMGFSITSLSGNVYSLSCIPMIFAGMEMGVFVDSLMVAIRSNRISKAEVLKEKIAQTACKAAIKGGMKLSSEDAICLVKESIENKVELFCPHGRPIVVKIRKLELEKWFKRI